jgi:hypothetical protein
MIFRPLLSATFVGMLVAAPLPALASSQTDSRLAQTLSDRSTQRSVAIALGAMSEVVLNLRLAPLARAIEAAEGGDPDAVDPQVRLRDFAGPKAERIPYEMSRRVPALMGAAGEMAGAVDTAAPALRAMAEAMRARIDDALER